MGRNKWGAYDKDNQSRLKTSMLRVSLCDYSNACILIKKTITVAITAARMRQIMLPIKR